MKILMSWFRKLHNAILEGGKQKPTKYGSLYDISVENVARTGWDEAARIERRLIGNGDRHTIGCDEREYIEKVEADYVRVGWVSHEKLEERVGHKLSFAISQWAEDGLVDELTIVDKFPYKYYRPFWVQDKILKRPCSYNTRMIHKLPESYRRRVTKMSDKLYEQVHGFRTSSVSKPTPSETDDDAYQMVMRKRQFERDYQNWCNSRGRAYPEPKWEDYANRHYNPDFNPYRDYDPGFAERDQKYQEDMHRY